MCGERAKRAFHICRQDAKSVFLLCFAERVDALEDAFCLNFSPRKCWVNFCAQGVAEVDKAGGEYVIFFLGVVSN